jgi:hypothetical protein
MRYFSSLSVYKIVRMNSTARLTIPRKIANRIVGYHYIVDFKQENGKTILSYVRFKDKAHEGLYEVPHLVMPSMFGTGYTFTIPDRIFNTCSLKFGQFFKLTYSLVPSISLEYTSISEEEVLAEWEKSHGNLTIKNIRSDFKERKIIGHVATNPNCIEGTCGHKTFLEKKKEHMQFLKNLDLKDKVWIRRCKECGNIQEDKKPLTPEMMTDRYIKRRCKECREVETLTFGEEQYKPGATMRIFKTMLED